MASPAIVAKVCEVEDVSFFKVPSYLNGLKHRTITFAIAAGVTDYQLAVRFIKNVKL